MLESGFFPELNANRVRRLRDMNAAIGRAYRSAMKDAAESQMKKNNVIAATYLRYAAANSVLLGDFPQSSDLFVEASSLYVLAGSSYGILMEILGGHHLANSPWFGFSTSAQSVYGLISALGDKSSEPKHLLSFRKKLEDFRGSRIGIFATPVDHYLDVFDGLLKVIETDASPKLLREALLPFIHTYAAALRRARRDRFHWSRLSMVFHPVEPDLIGLFIIVANALPRANMDYSYIFEGLPVDRETINILTYCIEKLGRNYHNGFERGKE